MSAALAAVGLALLLAAASVLGASHRTLTPRAMADFERRYGQHPTPNGEGVRQYTRAGKE